MNSPAIRPANFTRHTHDLAGKLRRERRYGFLALYHLMRLSDFGREGIERSGSYRFADHLYANRASGRGWIGRVIDRVLLNLPAARAMRQRCIESTAAMQRAFAANHTTHHAADPFRILTVPCGLPRDVRDFAARLHSENPAAPERIEYTGMDLDPEVITAARTFLAGSHVPSPQWVQGDALDAASFPPGPFHFIASTGLGEFLDDAQLATFYANVHRVLAPGGVFFTSATAREPRSDAILRAFELHTHYRTCAEVGRQLVQSTWREVRCTHDATGLQTFVHAVK